MNYEDMLEKAYNELPEIRVSKKRFEMPKVDSTVSGNTTYILNFTQIANYLNRDPKHMVKFFSRELAAPGGVQGTKAMFVGKFSGRRLQEVLENYVNEYVICKQCGHADTKLVKEDRITFIECMACNARYPARSIR